MGRDKRDKGAEVTPFALTPIGLLTRRLYTLPSQFDPNEKRLQLGRQCIVGYLTKIYIAAFLLFNLVLNCTSIQAEELARIDIISGRPLALLPYDCEPVDPTSRKNGTVWIEHPIWVWKGLNANGDSAQIIFGGNVPQGEDRNSQITRKWIPGGNAVSETPIWMTLTDLRLHRSAGEQEWFVLGGGVRNDSAFFFTLDQTSGDVIEVALGFGNDITGDGNWSGTVIVHLVSDYDFDGIPEAFVEVNGERDQLPKTLSCVEITTQKLEWNIDVPSCIRYVADCRDSEKSAIFLVTSGCGGYVDLPDFVSSRGYLTKIDASGKRTLHRAISGMSNPVQMLAMYDSLHFVVTHYTSLEAGAELDSNFANPQISRIDGYGNVVRTLALPKRPISIWESEFGKTNEPRLFVLLERGEVHSFDTALQPIAQSGESDLKEFRGELSEFAGKGPVWVFFKGDSTGIYDRSFRELARIDAGEAYLQNLGKTRKPPNTAFVLSSRSSYTIFETRRKGPLDKLLILYFDYRIYVVGLLASLIGGLAMVFYSRERTKRDLATIRKQKQELEDTHRELKAAQAVIVEQEKYRQAKDIAGGFAHEIKNALFPADGALIKQERLLRNSEPDLGRILATHQAVRSAMARAIDLTRQITIYTKLETEVRAESVNLLAVLNEITSANEPLIKELNIMLALTGPSDATVNIRFDHLRSVFNNLLLNSIDALADRKEPRIGIDWQIVGNQVVINWLDNGCGISDEDTPRVFDAFFSTKPTTGTGLGLSVSKKILEFYGGSISVESKVDEGTSFHLRLPMIKEGSDCQDGQGRH